MWLDSFLLPSLPLSHDDGMIPHTELRYTSPPAIPSRQGICHSHKKRLNTVWLCGLLRDTTPWGPDLGQGTWFDFSDDGTQERWLLWLMERKPGESLRGAHRPFQTPPTAISTCTPSSMLSTSYSPHVLQRHIPTSQLKKDARPELREEALLCTTQRMQTVGNNFF